VRRAKGRRPPQYLDLDADVKFADVAGLGDIRKELEEIVDFFTFGEKYRRRGSKIPGMDCQTLTIHLYRSPLVLL
jgi:ATP-dependent Zn protease